MCGAALQLLLYGIFLTVFIHYATSVIQSHTKRMRTALWTVAALTTFQTGLCFEELFRLAGAYHRPAQLVATADSSLLRFTVTNRRSVNEILSASWELAISPLITGLVALICTSVLTSRASSVSIFDVR